MKRTILMNGLVNGLAHGLVYALMAATAVALGAQEANQSNPYQGTSNPPPDSTITTQAPEAAPQYTPQAKPSPSHYGQPPSTVAPMSQPAPPPYAAETVPNETLLLQPALPRRFQLRPVATVPTTALCRWRRQTTLPSRL